jgi:hypothetical protein
MKRGIRNSVAHRLFPALWGFPGRIAQMATIRRTRRADETMSAIDGSSSLNPAGARAMTRTGLLKIAFFGAAAVVVPVGAVAAQSWMPGSEISGQTMQVQTNGVMNTIAFNADGTATIMTPSGTSVPGTWSAANNMLCLSANGGQECWPYSQPFQAGQQVALTSSCQQVTTFVPQATNPPMQRSAGERG